MKRLVFLLPLILPIVLLAITGCAPVRTHHYTVEGAKNYVDQLSDAEKTRIRADIAGRIQEGLQRYHLAPGDQIEVMYHISLTPQAEEYRLGVNDEINVEFYYHPQLNRTLVIRPDGRITMPIKGDFRASGLNPPELAKLIGEAYTDILQDPLVTVNVNKFSSHITELQKAVTNSPRGQARLLTIAPDGKIYPPLLKSIRAAGRTADDVQGELSREYRRGFGNIDISVLVESVAGNRIFVFGEVARPGPIPMSQPLTALQAIAYSGNVLPTGALDKVKVLYWNEDRQATVRTINLENVMLGLRTEEDIVLPNNSVVYVPKTAIAKADQFVDQYIRQLLLWQGANLSFTYEIHKVPVPNSRY